jgi:hypothetical protein
MKEESVYENKQLGLFIMSIGYHLKEMGKPLIASINLSQQTPDDYRFSDVFGGISGNYF